MSSTADQADDVNLDWKVRPGHAEWQRRLFVVIFGHHSDAGRRFDVVLLIAVLASTIAVMLETVGWINKQYKGYLVTLEWCFTIAFTLEYVLRMACLRHKRAYAVSFFGVVDLLAILPTYISLLLPGSQALATVRALRLLRVFRILKLVPLVREGTALRDAIWHSRDKLLVFLLAVTVAVTIMGSLMYFIEGADNGVGTVNPNLDSIPKGIYWAVVTMTTVGYGDIVPQTAFGKFLTVVLIIFGYSLIVIPTGIVSASMGDAPTPAVKPSLPSPPRCPNCDRPAAEPAAPFCAWCGSRRSSA